MLGEESISLASSFKTRAKQPICHFQRVPNVKKKDITNLIDIVLTDLEKNRFINDKFYSESKAKSMIQRGNSINKIRSYLFGKGINDEFIKDDYGG